MDAEIGIVLCSDFRYFLFVLTLKGMRFGLGGRFLIIIW